jgi:catechol 2,3-dioxygenase-like lactoylglutathione lyase family enzyme
MVHRQRILRRRHRSTAARWQRLAADADSQLVCDNGAAATRSEAGESMTEWDREIGAMTLYVPDLERAQEFYQDVFGLEARTMDESTVMVRFKNMYVFLHKAAAVHDPLPEVHEEAQAGAGQFAIIVADVDAVCAEVAGRGVALLSGPADRSWGMRTATFADPAGHVWEIAQEIP